MSTGLTVFDLPSVQSFQDSISRDLRRRRSVIALAPNGIEAGDILSRLQYELERRELSIKGVKITGLEPHASPLVSLAMAIGHKWPDSVSPRTLSSFLTSPSLPDIIALSGIESLPETVTKTWLRFTAAWAQTSQIIAESGKYPSAIALIGSLNKVPIDLPPSSLYLSIRYWWGIPSSLEMQLLCRLRNSEDLRSPSARWREFLLPSLVGNDVKLLQYLWDDLQLAPSQLTARLCEYAAQRGWTAEHLVAWGAEDAYSLMQHNENESVLLPPSDLSELWTKGVVNWTPEHGMELHSAALAMLGFEEELQHRIWRGEAELLLPLVDRVRLLLCNLLTQRYGRDWPVRWFQPDSEQDAAAVAANPLACEWGYLEWLLIHCQALRGEQKIVTLASLGRGIRNELAHYRPITFHDFDGFWREIQRGLAITTF